MHGIGCQKKVELSILVSCPNRIGRCGNTYPHDGYHLATLHSTTLTDGIRKRNCSPEVQFVCLCEYTTVGSLSTSKAIKRSMIKKWKKQDYVCLFAFEQRHLISFQYLKWTNGLQLCIRTHTHKLYFGTAMTFSHSTLQRAMQCCQNGNQRWDMCCHSANGNQCNWDWSLI